MKAIESSKITLVPKGGNSPIRFCIMLNGKKIAYAKRANKRGVKKDIWTVHVNDDSYRQLVSEYMFNVQGIDRFYWN